MPKGSQHDVETSRSRPLDQSVGPGRETAVDFLHGERERERERESEREREREREGGASVPEVSFFFGSATFLHRCGGLGVRDDTSLNMLRRAVGKIGLSIVEEERHGPSGAKTERGAPVTRVHATLGSCGLRCEGVAGAPKLR